MQSDKIRLTVKRTGKSIELDQSRVKIRENQNGVMALSYVAPIFDVMDVEDFFEDALSSEKICMNIGGTGDAVVSFRGLIEGNNRNFPQNLDHKIILLQEFTWRDDRENVQLTGFSRFVPRGRLSDEEL